MPQALLPQIGGHVDQNAGALILDQDAGPQAGVLGVVGVTRPPVPPHHGNPAGTAGAKQGDLHKDLCPLNSYK